MRIKCPAWLVGVVVLVGTLAFVKWEMARNRRMLAEEIDRSVADAPARIAASAVKAATQLLNTNPAPAASQSDTQQNQAPDLLGGLLNLATKTGQRAAQILSSNAPAAGKSNDATQQQDAVGTMMDLAAKTAQKVDEAGLKVTELSDEEEMQFGEQLDRDILREMPEDANPQARARLEALAKPLIEQCQRKGIHYRIRIVNSSKINAFGCAGGRVYITTAFLKRFPADEEAAMTLGHELAHIELKHAVHKVQYLYRGRKTFGGFADIGQAAYSALSAPYTKDQEFDADAQGFDFCRKAGWQASKLFSVYEGLMKLEQEQDQKRAGSSSEPVSELERRLGDYFSSHPHTADRLARLKARAS